MLKRITFILLLALAAAQANAQTPDSLLNRLGDFDLARFYNNTDRALVLGERILPDTAKFSLKIRISFFGRMAKLYEDKEQDARAIFYYSKVVAAVPDYYVAQRALGYLYYKDAREKHLKLFAAAKNSPAYPQLFNAYKSAVQKALPYLEKAQACDPSDETLDLIKSLYQNIHDERGLSSLNDRLNGLGKNCIDILTEN